MPNFQREYFFLTNVGSYKFDALASFTKIAVQLKNMEKGRIIIFCIRILKDNIQYLQMTRLYLK
jgi:hypothetical protein